jgi:hypothetical protein
MTASKADQIVNHMAGTLNDHVACKHEFLQVIPNAEGDLGEAHLTRHFTTYYCPDCDYEAEEPPEGWVEPEPDYEALQWD